MGKTYTGYVGTYTRQSSKGIYRFTLNTETQTLSEPVVAAEVGNPTYLAISEDKKYLYSVAQKEDLGGIAAFQIVNEEGELELINVELEQGAPPCHLETHGEYVVSGNYHKGEASLYRVKEDNGIEFLNSVIHEGTGPHELQEKPHVHFTGYSPDKKYVLCVDLGTDEVVTYKIDEDKLIAVQTLKLKPGSGPRHLTFHPNGKWAYVLTELSSEVVVLDYDQETGKFTEKQTILAKPEDFTGQNDASAIHISSDGRFVYAGNRGHNSIAVLKVDEQDGTLSLVEIVPSGGDWPRDFAIDPSGDFIVCSHQHSGNLVLFSRDQETGKLTKLPSEVQVPEAVCVKFL